MLDIKIAITGLIFSIIFSGSEIAMLSANVMQINVWQKQKLRLSALAATVLQNKEEYLTLILVGTNIANILTNSFATIYMLRQGISTEIIMILIVVIILLFGEILPKTFIRQYANISLLILSPILVLTRIFLYPIVFLVKLTGISEINQSPSSKKVREEKRDDIQFAYEHVMDLDTIEKDQQEMISNVFEISESFVYEVMTQRIDISSVSTNDPLEKVLHVFIDSGHSKLPVYDNSLDNIVGVVYLYDLFNSPSNLKSVTKPAMFVPYSKLLINVMSEFQSSHHALAIVLDEHGGTAGLITAEDIFEELFGDFEDEFDLDETIGEKLDDGSIIINGKLTYESFNNEFGNIIPEGEYETVGGYVISETGRIPNQGEHIFTSIGQIIIRKATARRIEQLQIYPQENSISN